MGAGTKPGSAEIAQSSRSAGARVRPDRPAPVGQGRLPLGPRGCTRRGIGDERTLMDFRLDDEQLALRDAAAAICAQHFDLAAVASREGARATDAAWRALADLGLFGLLAADGVQGC